MPSEFLNQKSIFTPAIAGALVLTLTNTVSNQFNLPHKWVALLLSVLISIAYILETNRKEKNIIQCLILLILNSLIVFTFSVGGNSIGGEISNSATIKTMHSASMESNEPLALEVPKKNEKFFFRAWFQK